MRKIYSAYVQEGRMFIQMAIKPETNDVRVTDLPIGCIINQEN